jgi:di/tricarboxylate transporter
MPDPHAIAVMLLTGVALYLFSRDNLPIETSSLLVIAILAIGFTVFPWHGGELDPLRFFAGFGNEALVAISALMMASQGLIATGALAPMGRIVSRVWQLSPLLAMGIVLLLTAVTSAFMNNTPQVVLMIPLLTTVALRSKSSPSKLLMPMTFASQIGGMATPIGTSLNLLVIGAAVSQGVPRFHMFDFFVPAAIAGAFGLTYLWLIAPRLLPDLRPAFPDTKPRVFEAQLHIDEQSAVAGKTLAQARAMLDGELNVRVADTASVCRSVAGRDVATR